MPIGVCVPLLRTRRKCRLTTLAVLDILSSVMEKASDLSQFLRQGRTRKGMTLRAVERATNISNAYLSQLESGKILKPSPGVLHKLCELYGISYSTAMRCAGHPVPSGADGVSERPSFAARLGPTTAEEEDALAEYLDFLRSRQRRNAPQ